MKQGDVINIRHGRAIFRGCVDLASSNGVSLIISFEALIGGHAGKMPVLGSPVTGEYHSIIDGTRIFIEKAVTH